MNTFLANLRELAISFDQFANVLMCLLTGRVGYSDETLSAHAWRSYAAGKVWGKVWRPLIDAMFAWQATDPDYPEAKGHCHRAFLKEKDKRYMPPEYR